jgi:TrmH RNA methyltransferase
MTDEKPPRGASLYRGPSSAPRDKRQRERDRAQEPSRETRAADRPQRGPRDEAPRGPRRAPPRDDAPRTREIVHDEGPRSPREQRIYGLNACLALFAKRPEAIRKVWLLENRIPKLKAVLAWCVQHRLGYTLVQADDLEKLSGSAHHEGVCFGTLPMEEANLSDWLRDLPTGPAVALWLDGVGNPHNLGAILRSAAHFGAGAVLLPKDSELALSGAAARVAEGGAEAVPMVRLGRGDNALAQLASAGFGIAATVVRGGTPLHAAKLPQRLVWVLGAEQLGVDADLAQRAAVRIAIPGTGQVESLNVAAAAAVLLAEWWRQQGPRHTSAPHPGAKHASPKTHG